MTGGPWTRSIKVVHGPGPRWGSMDPWSMFCPHPFSLFIMCYRTLIYPDNVSQAWEIVLDVCRDLQWVAQKCHGNFNLLTAISICSRQLQQQFQFVHGNFNLLKAISICSQQLQQQFQFAHRNFNLLTAISFFSRQCLAFFASLTTCQLWRPTVATKHQLKHKIESQYLKSIFFTAPRKL